MLFSMFVIQGSIEDNAAPADRPDDGGLASEAVQSFMGHRQDGQLREELVALCTRGIAACLEKKGVDVRRIALMVANRSHSTLAVNVGGRILVADSDLPETPTMVFLLVKTESNAWVCFVSDTVNSQTALVTLVGSSHLEISTPEVTEAICYLPPGIAGMLKLTDTPTAYVVNDVAANAQMSTPGLLLALIYRVIEQGLGVNGMKALVETEMAGWQQRVDGVKEWCRLGVEICYAVKC